MFTSKYRNRSFGEILDINNGAGLGFDILRFGLAGMILLSHTSGITGNSGMGSAILGWLFRITPEASHAINQTVAVAQEGGRTLKGLARPLTLSYVPMFFALSGFLVTGSAFRVRNVVRFLGLRVLRILPALLVEVTLSAIILGAVFTTLPLREYFSHPGFHAYFLNVLGIVHYTLPGVFVGTSNSPNVNSNLWTLPAEFQCYVMLSILMVVGAIWWKKLLTVVFCMATVGLLIANTFYGYQVVGANLPSAVVVYYFFVGMLFFIWRDKIIYHEGFFIGAAIISYPLMMFTNTVYIYPLLLTYITVFIGLSPLPQFKLFKTGDYSYGIYLYGYPVTQAVVAALPSMRGNFLFVAGMSILLTSLFAWLSWHGVEKHFMKLKKYISPKSSKIVERLHPEIVEDGPLNAVVEANVVRS